MRWLAVNSEEEIIYEEDKNINRKQHVVDLKGPYNTDVDLKENKLINHGENAAKQEFALRQGRSGLLGEELGTTATSVDATREKQTDSTHSNEDEDPLVVHPEGHKEPEYDVTRLLCTILRSTASKK